MQAESRFQELFMNQAQHFSPSDFGSQTGLHQIHAPENIHAAFDALAVIGFKPTLPVTAAQFAVPSIRKSWREQKNMQVLQFWADTYPDLKLDIFIEHPFDFENEWKNAKETKFGKGQNAIRVVNIPALIEMKRTANRPKDLLDIQYLQKIQGGSVE